MNRQEFSYVQRIIVKHLKYIFDIYNKRNICLNRFAIVLRINGLQRTQSGLLLVDSGKSVSLGYVFYHKQFIIAFISYLLLC